MIDPDTRAKDPGLNTSLIRRRKISEGIAVTKNQKHIGEDIGLSVLTETIMVNGQRDTIQTVTLTRDHLNTQPLLPKKTLLEPLNLMTVRVERAHLRYQ